MIDPHSPVTEEELHAYVDGELALDRRMSVEAWLGLHPEGAVPGGSWRRPAQAIPPPYGAVGEGGVPPRLDVDRRGRRSRRWAWVAAAAVVLAFLAGGVSGWYGRTAFDGGAAPRMVTAEAIQAYNLYVVEVRHPVEVPGTE